MANNPNAFPTNDITPDCTGMTQRDWFAGQALVALAAHGFLVPEEMARYAYEVADAMLAERAK